MPRQVSLDAYLSFQSKPKEYDVLNAQQFATLSNEVEAADSTHTYKGLLHPGIIRTPCTMLTGRMRSYRTGLTQNYNLAIRGGNEKVQSAVSVGYYDQKGIVLGSYFQRAEPGR